MAISSRRADDARRLIKSCGATELVEGLLNPKNSGRPRRLSVEALLFGMFFALESNQLTARTIHAVLTKEISTDARIRLGVAWSEPGSGMQQVTISQVQYLLKAIKGRLTGEELDTALNMIVRAAHGAAPVASGAYSVDSTTVNSWVFATNENKPHGDAEAATGFTNSSDYRFKMADGNKFVSGFKAHAATRTPAIPIPGRTWANNQPDTPQLVDWMLFKPANHSDSKLGPQLVQLAETKTLPVEMLIVDKGYSQAAAAEMHIPLREVGVTLVSHLKGEGPNPYIDANGQRVVRGAQYCPEVPKHLWDPKIYGEETPDEKREREALLSKYRSQTVAKTQDNMPRQKCAGLCGTVACPLVDPPRGKSPTVEVEPSEKHLKRKCCTQQTFSTPVEIEPSRIQAQQEYPDGTPVHRKIMDGRSSVERSFGHLKEKFGFRRGKVKMVGMTLNGLTTALGFLRANIMMLDAWLERNGHNKVLAMDENLFWDETPALSGASVARPLDKDPPRPNAFCRN